MAATTIRPRRRLRFPAPRPTAVERWSPAFLQHGPVEAFAHRVVVGRAGRDAVVGESFGGHCGAERSSDVLGAVIGEHGPDGDAEAAEARFGLRRVGSWIKRTRRGRR